MKHILHRGYFREMFRQLRVPGIISTAILLLPNFSTIVTLLASKAFGDNIDMPGASVMALLMMIYIYVAGFLLTFIAYNWLNHRSTSDFYHAIPVTRTQIYASTTLSVFLWMAIAVTASSVVNLLIYLISGMPFNYPAFLCIYVNMLIGAIQIVGAVSLACALSGTRFVNFFASFFILFIPRFMLIMFGLMINVLTDMLPLKELSFLFNPSYNIFGMPYGSLIDFFVDMKLSETDFANIGAIIYSLVHACLLVFLGGVVFHRRKSELAGIHMRSKLLQTAIRVAFGLPLLLVLVLILQSESFNISLIVVLVLFSFTFYCLYELISTKSAKKMVRSMPLYSICIGIALIYFFVPQLVVKVALSARVDTETVCGFRLVESDHYTQTYSDIMCEKVTIDDPDGIDLIIKAYDRAKDTENAYNGNLKKIVIERKNGLSLTRRVLFLPNEYERLQSIAMRDETYCAYQTEFPTGVVRCYANGLTDQEASEIAAIYRDEYNTLNESDRSMLDSLSEFNYGLYRQRCLYQFTVQGFIGTKTYSQSFCVSELTPKSAARFAQILNQKNGAQFDRAIHALQDRLENSELIDNTWSIGICSDIYLYGYDLFTEDGKDSFTVNSFPECYEIVRMLADAELTDDSKEAVTVTLHDMQYLTGISSDHTGSSITVSVRLTDSDIQAIERNISRIYERLGY